MSSLNLSNGCAPESSAPLMRNAGVPFAPTFVPSAASSSTFLACFFDATSALNFAGSTPAECFAELACDLAEGGLLAGRQRADAAAAVVQLHDLLGMAPH